MTGSAVAPATTTCWAGASSSSSEMTKPLFSPPSSSSSASALTASGPSSPVSSSPASSASFLEAVFLAAVFLAAVFLAGAAFLAAVFFAAVFLAAGSVPGSPASASTVSGSAAAAAGAAVAAGCAAVVLAAVFLTVSVAVRLAGLLAATLLRVVRLGDSAALTISVTPSSSRIWLRLRRTFFHWVAGIWSASKARRTSSPAICPSALPRSMSAITDSESAISGGSVRDVLADTNNLSERWERLPTPGLVVLDRSRRPPTGDGPAARAGAGELHSTPKGCCLPSVGHHLLRHRVTSQSVTPNIRGPSHTPYARVPLLWSYRVLHACRTTTKGVSRRCRRTRPGPATRSAPPRPRACARQCSRGAGTTRSTSG